METGRPRKFEKPEELARKVEEYIEQFQDPDIEQVPSIWGLALHTHVNRDTLYEYWKKDGFSGILDDFKSFCINWIYAKSFHKKADSAIARLILSNHGIREKQEIEHTGNGLNITIKKAE